MAEIEVKLKPIFINGFKKVLAAEPEPRRQNKKVENLTLKLNKTMPEKFGEIPTPSPEEEEAVKEVEEEKVEEGVEEEAEETASEKAPEEELEEKPEEIEVEKEEGEAEEKGKKLKPLTSEEIFEFHKWGGSYRARGEPISDPKVIERLDKLSPEEKNEMKQRLGELIEKQQHELKELVWGHSSYWEAPPLDDPEKQKKINEQREEERKNFWKEWNKLDIEKQKRRIGRALQLRDPEALYRSGHEFRERVDLEHRRMQRKAEEEREKA